MRVDEVHKLASVQPVYRPHSSPGSHPVQHVYSSRCCQSRMWSVPSAPASQLVWCPASSCNSRASRQMCIDSLVGRALTSMARSRSDKRMRRSRRCFGFPHASWDVERAGGGGGDQHGRWHWHGSNGGALRAESMQGGVKLGRNGAACRRVGWGNETRIGALSDVFSNLLPSPW